MRPAPGDLAARRPVWQALSDLYLDTTLSEAEQLANARILAASPYEPDELRRILRDEVNPACLGNLLSVAGLWTGFDAGRLTARILARQRAAVTWPARLLPVPRSVRRQFETALRQALILRANH